MINSIYRSDSLWKWTLHRWTINTHHILSKLISTRPLNTVYFLQPLTYQSINLSNLYCLLLLNLDIQIMNRLTLKRLTFQLQFIVYIYIISIYFPCYILTLNICHYYYAVINNHAVCADLVLTVFNQHLTGIMCVASCSHEIKMTYNLYRFLLITLYDYFKNI